MRCNGEALPGALQPGDLAVWDGHVAMIDGNGVMVEAKDQWGCRPTANRGIAAAHLYAPRSPGMSPAPELGTPARAGIGSDRKEATHHSQAIFPSLSALSAPTMTQAGRGGQMTIAVQPDFLNSTACWIACTTSVMSATASIRYPRSSRICLGRRTRSFICARCAWSYTTHLTEHDGILRSRSTR